ncbi:MAG: Rossmann-like domain-containing protein [Anaerolineales bacterium]
MNILEQITNGLTDSRVEKICVGAHWSAVVVDIEGQRRCGLASNPIKAFELDQAQQHAISEYQKLTALEVARLVLDHDPAFSGVGMAAINALLPQEPDQWTDANAGDLIADKGKGKRVALVGHFPFVDNLRQRVGQLDILELRPRDGDIPASFAPEVIPQADVVAITSMAFVNGTMEGLLELCQPHSFVIVLGPSTPLSPLLFSAGVDMLGGSIVERIDPVCQSILNGDSFQQVRQHGVRLVAIENPGI